MADRDERTQELLHRFHAAENYRLPFEDVAERCYQLFTCYRKPLEPGDRRSNLFIPRTYSRVAALRARLFKMLVGAKPWIDFLPVGVEDRARAQLQSSLVEHQSERTGFRSAFWDWLTALLVYPAAIGYVGWRYKARKRKVRRPLRVGPITIRLWGTIQEILADDNEFANVDFWDFWPDPRGKDIDSCRYVWHREWLTRDQIEDRLAVLERAGEGTVYRPDWEAVESARSDVFQTGAERRATSVGKPAPSASLGLTSEDRSTWTHEVLHYWEDDAHAMILNRKVLVYDGPNPYWHRRKPYVALAFEPLGGEFYGKSAVEILEALQHELNTLRNQRIDNVSLVLNRMWYRRDPDAVPDEQLVSRPGGIIDAWEDQVKPVQTPDVTASAYNDEAIIKQDIDDALGTPALTSGALPPRKETATAAAILSEGAGTRVEALVFLIEDRVLKRLAYLMDCNNQQFIDAPRVIRLYGAQGLTWGTVTPEDVRGQKDYLPASAATEAAANKTLRRQQLTEVLAILGRAPALLQWVNLPALLRLILENYDIRNLDELILQQPAAMPMLPAAGGPPPTPEAGGLPPAALAAMLGGLLGGGPQVPTAPEPQLTGGMPGAVPQ